MQVTRKSRSLVRRLCGQIYRNRPDPLVGRVKLAAPLAELQEEGQIAVVHGGIDCDGGRWDNRVAVIPATVAAIVCWSDRFAAQAEGDQWQTLAKPSLVRELTGDSRDLGREAFEDGHAHVRFA